MSTSESAPTLTFGQFSEEYLAAAQTLANKDCLDPQTREQMKNSIKYLRGNYPQHLRLLQETVEFDLDINPLPLPETL